MHDRLPNPATLLHAPPGPQGGPYRDSGRPSGPGGGEPTPPEENARSEGGPRRQGPASGYGPSGQRAPGQRPPDHRPPGHSPPGHSPPGDGPPVTEGQWERLRAPFDPGQYVPRIVSGANEGTKAIVRFTLWPEAVEERLAAVLGPGQYSTDYEPVPSADRPALLCRLHIGRAQQGGIGTANNWRYARGRALTDAALGFGLGRAGKQAGRVVADVDHRVDVPEETREALQRPAEPSMRTPSRT